MSNGCDVLLVGVVFLPIFSIQHFIWPLSWCLLADICNHTWIPECGYDELLDGLRTFIDECDMFEFNCDYETDYEVTNYSRCFGHVICPKPKPCPSRPTCPDHRFHRMGDRYVFLNARRSARQGRRMNDLKGSTLPMQMMKGKRRYTPKSGRRFRTRHTTPKRTRPKGPPTKHIHPGQRKLPLVTTVTTRETTKPTPRKTTSTPTTTSSIATTRSEQQTVILNRETVIVNGKRAIKIIKGIVNKQGKILHTDEHFNNKIDTDFLE